MINVVSIRVVAIGTMSRRFKDPVLLLLALGLLGSGQASAEEDLLLSKAKAAPIEIGMGVDDLYAKIGQERAKLVDLHSEGFFAPALEICLNRDQPTKPSLAAEIEGRGKSYTVWRISVYDARFKTDKGVGVGSTLGDVRRNYKVNWIAAGEGSVMARAEEIGMSFSLDIAKIPDQWYKTRNPSSIPDDVRVIAILIVH